MGNRWQLLRGFPRRLLGLGQPVSLLCGGVSTLESCYLLFCLLCWELRDVITWCIYTVMILLLICWLMCATILGAHIRCKHSILSFNWSVTSPVVLSSARTKGLYNIAASSRVQHACCWWPKSGVGGSPRQTRRWQWPFLSSVQTQKRGREGLAQLLGSPHLSMGSFGVVGTHGKATDSVDVEAMANEGQRAATCDL
jgi:hypothetical protein